MRMTRRTPTDFLATLLALALLLAWDASGLDLVLARPFATAEGFALQNHWLLAEALHKGARVAAWLPCLWLIAGIWWPHGLLGRIGQPQRVQWVVTTLLALIAIAALKQASLTSCPWDLAQFGGQAAWASHWAFQWGGGGGHCFPAGHASAGFAFVGGYFALRRQLPGQARAWLVGSLAAGLVLGVSQQLRGAHFMSHTLWTAWLCWTIAWLVDMAVRRLAPLPARVSAEMPVLPAVQAPAG
ncbi:MAG: phosphatidic acid phosphatase [Ramlibacter sp.]|nr:phosphatidic acid phosphatase [Ramlibacter sp.]